MTCMPSLMLKPQENCKCFLINWCSWKEPSMYLFAKHLTKKNWLLTQTFAVGKQILSMPFSYAVALLQLIAIRLMYHHSEKQYS